MEPIEKAAQRALQRASMPPTHRNQTSPPVIASDERTERLWKRMARIYGYKWSSQYGVEDDGTWSVGLRDLTEDEVFNGLEACMKATGEWPPALPEFRRLCRPERRENEAMYRLPPGRQLPHLLSDEARAQGRAALATLKASLA